MTLDNTLTRPIMIVLFLAIAGSLSSCVKLKDVYIMKGEFVVESIEINGGLGNQMPAILPNYVEGEGKYIIYFGEDGEAAAQYYVADTLNYALAGEWQLLDDHHMYLNVDRFVKGTFVIEEQSLSDLLMYSDKNYIEFFGIGEVEMLIRSHRN
jgi:hypothetical protein